MSSTVIGLNIISTQVQHCEDIVDKIDLIVPKLYKIRQQAIAQKNYIIDVNHSIIESTGQINSTDKVATSANSNYNFSDLDSIDSDVIKDANASNTKKVINSLFKYKHNIGSSKHFTTDLKGNETTAARGSNLIHIKQFTDELNNLLSASNTVAISSANSLYIDYSNVQNAPNPVDDSIPINNTSHNSFGSIATVSGSLVGLGLT